MKRRTIETKLRKCINLLKILDHHLLEKDLSERSITHKLAEYLKVTFSNYDVDCEYNWSSTEDRKKIEVLAEELYKLWRLSEKDKKNYKNWELHKESIERQVYPDIIIHKRWNNKENLCIIEVKKSSNTSGEDLEYDRLKMIEYTKNGRLWYKHWFFITLQTWKDFKEKENEKEIEYYENWKNKTEE